MFLIYLQERKVQSMLKKKQQQINNKSLNMHTLVILCTQSGVNLVAGLDTRPDRVMYTSPLAESGFSGTADLV